MFSSVQRIIAEQLLNSVFAFDFSKFEKETGVGQGELEGMIESIRSGKEDQLDGNKLKAVLTVAAEFADPEEIHPLTGYSWQEVQGLIKSL